MMVVFLCRSQNTVIGISHCYFRIITLCNAGIRINNYVVGNVSTAASDLEICCENNDLIWIARWLPWFRTTLFKGNCENMPKMRMLLRFLDIYGIIGHL